MKDWITTEFDWRQVMRKIAIMFLALVFVCGAALASDDTEVYERDIVYDNEKLVKIEVDFGLGEISVARARGDFIARIHGEYDSRYFEADVKYDRNGGEGKLVLKVKKKKSLLKMSGEIDNQWEILLGDMAPLELNLDAGMAEVNFDFSGLEIVGLSMDVGMASGNIFFNKPNKGRIEHFVIDAGQSSMECSGFGNANFKLLEIDAGMASMEIDFGGSLDFDGNVTIDAGMSSAEITLNPDMGNRIKYEGGITSSVDIPNGFTKIKKRTYQSDNYDKVKGHLNFEIDVSMGSVDFRFAESL
jgi:hypothetical protein